MTIPRINISYSKIIIVNLLQEYLNLILPGNGAASSYPNIERKKYFGHDQQQAKKVISSQMLILPLSRQYYLFLHYFIHTN